MPTKPTAKTPRKKTSRTRKPMTAIIDGIEIKLGRVHGKHKQPISLLRKIVDAAIARRKAIEEKA